MVPEKEMKQILWKCPHKYKERSPHLCNRCTLDRLVMTFTGQKHIWHSRWKWKQEWWMSIEYNNHLTIDFSHREIRDLAFSLRLPWQLGQSSQSGADYFFSLKAEKYQCNQVFELYITHTRAKISSLCFTNILWIWKVNLKQLFTKFKCIFESLVCFLIFLLDNPYLVNAPFFSNTTPPVCNTSFPLEMRNNPWWHYKGYFHKAPAEPQKTWYSYYRLSGDPYDDETYLMCKIGASLSRTLHFCKKII